MQTENIKVSKLKLNPNNPRVIKDDKYKKLLKSIKDFPKMLQLRPIVVNDDMVVLGGNQRLKACRDAGYKEVPTIKASELTADEQREFIIKDNVGFGDHDWQTLTDEWDYNDLEEWGLDVDNLLNNDDQSKQETKETVPYNLTHILLSFPPDKILELKETLDQILDLDFIEYEQSSN